MGLAIARGIVEAHGGRIWIEDAHQGRGARLVLTLPFGDEDESSAAQIEETDLSKIVEKSR